MSHTTPSTLSPSAAAFSFSRRNQLSSGGTSTWLSMRAVSSSLGVRSTSRVRTAPSYAACVTANVTPPVVSPSTRQAARYAMPSGRGAGAADAAAPKSSSAAKSAQIRLFIFPMPPLFSRFAENRHPYNERAGAGPASFFRHMKMMYGAARASLRKSIRYFDGSIHYFVIYAENGVRNLCIMYFLSFFVMI